MIQTSEDVLEFWFGDDLEDRDIVTSRLEIWFGSDPLYDSQIRDQFAETIERAVAGELDPWVQSARGSLALIILFDQFPRNIFRGEARAFATDGRALAIANSGIERGLDVELGLIERLFFYVPFEHAEDLDMQDRCASLFLELHDLATPAFKEIFANSVSQSKNHRDVIRRFGRFPTRNSALGRASNDEERAWIAANKGWPQNQDVDAD